MKFQIVKGSTSVILTVFIQDSSSTTEAGLGSLGPASSIVGGYVKRTGTGVALAVDENVTTEGTYEAPSTAAKVRIGDPANMITGVYELHFHNDLFTTADWVTIALGGAPNMAPLLIEIQLTGMDFDDADGSTLTEVGGDGAQLTEAGGDGDHLVEAGGDGDHLTAINLPNQTMDITGSLSGSVGSVTGAVGSVTAGVDLTYIMGTILTEGAGGRLAAAFIKLLDVATPLLVASDVMRGTNSAALASVLGTLADAAVGGDPTASDTVMQYVKQLVNILVGTAGVVTFPAEAAPGNGVSLAEVIRAIHVDTSTTLDGRIPAALSSGNMKSDVLAVNSSTSAAAQLALAAIGIESGAASAGTLSTTQMTTNLTEVTDDHYNGGVLIWTSGVLNRQRTDITDYDGATKKLTYTAVTEAPSATDTFVIV